MRYQLKNWSVVGDQDPWLAPECRHIHLSGEIYGRGGGFEDGKRVTTSRVVNVVGRIITTRSGSEYELVGDPELDYMKYLDDINREYNELEPIKIIRN